MYIGKFETYAVTVTAASTELIPALDAAITVTHPIDGEITILRTTDFVRYAPQDGAIYCGYGHAPTATFGFEVGSDVRDTGPTSNSVQAISKGGGNVEVYVSIQGRRV